MKNEQIKKDFDSIYQTLRDLLSAINFLWESVTLLYEGVLKDEK